MYVSSRLKIISFAFLMAIPLTPAFALDPNHPEIIAALEKDGDETSRYETLATVNILSDSMKLNNSQAAEVIRAFTNVSPDRQGAVRSSILNPFVPRTSETDLISLIELIGTSTQEHLDHFEKLKPILGLRCESEPQEGTGTAYMGILQNLMLSPTSRAKELMKCADLMKKHVFDRRASQGSGFSFEKRIEFICKLFNDLKNVSENDLVKLLKFTLYYSLPFSHSPIPTVKEQLFLHLNIFKDISSDRMPALSLCSLLTEPSQEFTSNINSFVKSIQRVNPNHIVRTAQFTKGILTSKVWNGLRLNGATGGVIFSGASQVPPGKEKAAFQDAYRIVFADEDLSMEERGCILGSLLPVVSKIPHGRDSKIFYMIKGLKGKKYKLSLDHYLILAKMSDARFEVIQKSYLNHMANSKKSPPPFFVWLLPALGFTDLGLDHEQLFRALAAVPYENFETVLCELEKRVKDRLTAVGYVEVIEALNPPSSPTQEATQEPPTLGQTIALNKLQGCALDRDFISSSFSKMRQIQVGYYAEAFLRLLGRNFWLPEEKKAVLTNIVKLPKYKLEGVVKAMQQFHSRWVTGGMEVATCVDAFSRIPLLRIDPIVTALTACPFNCTDAISVFGRKLIPSMIPTRNICLELIESLGIVNRSEVFKTLASYSVENLEVLANALPQHVKDLQLSEKGIVAILEALKKANPDHYDSILAGAQKIIGWKDEADYIETVQGLVGAHPQYLTEVIDITLNLRGNRNWSSEATLAFLKELASVHEKNREDVLPALRRYSQANPDIDGAQLKWLIHFLMNIPVERIDPVFKSAIVMSGNNPQIMFFKLNRVLGWLSDEALKTAEVVCKHFGLGNREQFEGVMSLFDSVPDHIHPIIRDDLGPLVGHAHQLKKILKVLPFMPEAQIQPFLRGAAASAVENEESFEDYYSNFDLILQRHAVAMGIADERKKDELHAHWMNILNDDDQEKSLKLVYFIAENYEKMGLRLEEDVVKFAHDVGFILEEDAENSPFRIFKSLQDKQAEEVNWDALPTLDQVVGNFNLKFRPQGVWELGLGMAPDYSKVPHVCSQDLTQLLLELQGRRVQGNFAADIDLEGKLDTLISLALHPTAYVQRLLESPRDHRMAAYLRYIVKRYRDINDEDERCMSIAQFLISVRNCDVGSGTAIEEIYFGLNDKYRMPCKGKEQHYPDESMKAFEILNQTVQKVTMEGLAEGSPYIRKVCRIGAKDNMVEPAHQAKVLRGVLCETLNNGGKLTFDLHAEYIYIPILQASLQDLLFKWYEGQNLKGMITHLNTRLNQSIEQSEDKALFSHFQKLFKKNWETCMIIDEEDRFKGLTEEGTIRLLRSAKIVEEKEGLF